MSERSRLKLTRISFWVLAVILAACQTWHSKHEILSDGTSYIEIAQAYLRHDWANAINPYWSPLYSWLIAASFGIFHPSPYWQTFTAHVVLFVSFVAALGTFEYFLHHLFELLPQDATGRSGVALSKVTFYLLSYAAFLFGGLSLVAMYYCSPDMIAFALTFFLCGSVLQVQRGLGSSRLYLAFGLASGLFFLARTAFSGLFIAFFLVFLLLLWKQNKSLWRPALLVVAPALALTLPFVIAISYKHGSPTIGESGRLNYGWEVCGADRFIDWQGKPFHNIGSPIHPTTEVLSSPRTFVFDHPIAGSYPPWYDPSYWYAGIRPSVNAGVQLKVLAVNVSVFLNYFWRSPIMLPALLLILVSGIVSWLSRFVQYWPILVPTVGGIGLYCLIYFEKRYIAANLVVIWIAMIASLRFSPAVKTWAAKLLLSFAFLHIVLIVVRHEKAALRDGIVDLFHRHESYRNVNYMLAENLQKAGLKPGDSIAYIGAGINADWTRLAGVRIVAEVPLMYKRADSFMNNTLRDDDSQIKAFWNASDSRKAQVMDSFRRAGAKMVVTDGFYGAKQARVWPEVLPQHLDGVFYDQRDIFNELNSRYIVLQKVDQ